MTQCKQQQRMYVVQMIWDKPTMLFAPAWVAPFIHVIKPRLLSLHCYLLITRMHCTLDHPPLHCMLIIILDPYISHPNCMLPFIFLAPMHAWIGIFLKIQLPSWWPSSISPKQLTTKSTAWEKKSKSTTLYTTCLAYYRWDVTITQIIYKY